MKSITLSLLIICLCSAKITAQTFTSEIQLQKEWVITNNSQANAIYSYCHSGANITKEYDSTVVFPNGNNGAMKVTVNIPTPRNYYMDIQLGFLDSATITKSKQYRISFYYKSTHNVLFEVGAIKSASPWWILSEKNSIHVRGNVKWQKAEFLFTAVTNFSGLARLPIIGLGKLPQGGALWLRDVKFELLDN